MDTCSYYNIPKSMNDKIDPHDCKEMFPAAIIAVR